MQELMDSISASMRAVRADYHLTLSQAIAILEALETDVLVTFDWNSCAPGEMMSYRGYYEDLALDWREAIATTTTGELLIMLTRSLNETFIGYKGGDFRMDKNTPLWAAQSGDTGRAIIGIKREADTVTLETKEVAV